MVEAARRQAARLLGQLADLCRVSRTGPDAFRDDHRATPEARMGYQLREVRPNTKSGVPVSGNAFQHWTVYSGAPAENASQGPVSTGWATPSSQQEIYAGCWAWWCSWQRWYVVEGYDSDQSSGGLPQHGARGPGIGQTRSQFLSGFYKKWPGGHHQQSCKVFPSPLRKRKSRCSQMRPTPAGEPN